MANRHRSLLDVEAAARYLGITQRHVRRLIHERRVPYVKIGNRVRLDPDDLDEFIADHRIGPR